VGIPWAEIVPDVIAGVSLAVASGATWFAKRSGDKAADIDAGSLEVSRSVAAIEASRRHAERTPRLTGELGAWGTGSSDLRLNVWLESTEALARLRVVVREARNNDGPIGFKRGLAGIPNDLPPDLELEGILPAWSTDSLSPIADWPRRLAPGNAAVFIMQTRQLAAMGAGTPGVRFKALAWPDDDGQPWELPLPVSIGEGAAEIIGRASGSGG
jgi:hypothetical protein